MTGSRNNEDEDAGARMMDQEDEEEEEEEDEEEDLEKLQAEIARMEAEAARITKETEELEKKKDAKLAAAAAAGGQASAAATAAGGAADSGKSAAARDSCSIYVGQVDYSTTPEELLKHFDACGTVERVTIVCDKFTGRPKGFAYLEFQNEEAVENAIKLDGSEFKGRQLKVTHKRVNVPGLVPTAGRGRGFRGGPPAGRGYRGGFRGRGRRGGGRAAVGYHPYY